MFKIMLPQDLHIISNWLLYSLEIESIDFSCLTEMAHPIQEAHRTLWVVACLSKSISEKKSDFQQKICYYILKRQCALYWDRLSISAREKTVRYVSFINYIFFWTLYRIVQARFCLDHAAIVLVELTWIDGSWNQTYNSDRIRIHVVIASYDVVSSLE